MATTTLNARVKQKVATEPYWLANEATLGPILDGEQAFVIDGSGTPINFKVGDGTKLFSQLPYFIAYFNNVTNCKVLWYLNQTGNITISNTFRSQSLLDKFVFINNSASPVTLNIGTTNGGTEIVQIILPTGTTVVTLDEYFAGVSTVYITGLTGVNYSMVILYYQLDEQPVIPSGGTVVATPKYVFGTLYTFYPMYLGHENAAFDFLTGYGKIGTDYEGSVLLGTNGLPDISDYYLKAYKAGDTLGGDTGSQTKTIDFNNLPQMRVDLPANAGGVPGSGGITFGGANNNTVTLGVKKQDGSGYLSQQPINVQPLSKSVLYFTGLPTT